MTRVNVYLDDVLLARIATITGPGNHRSSFISAAIREKLERSETGELPAWVTLQEHPGAGLLSLFAEVGGHRNAVRCRRSEIAAGVEKLRTWRAGLS